MSNTAFDIANGKTKKVQRGNGYSRTRVDMKEMKTLHGQGLARDVIASVVSAVLPKAVSAITEYVTPKIAQKIKGGKRCGGSFKLS